MGNTHAAPDALKSPVIKSKEGEFVSVVGDTYRIILPGTQTNKEFAVIDMMVPKGGGPGPHSHAEIDESFYVVDGEIEVRTEKGVYTASKGDYVNIPKGGLVHQFKNLNEKTAHLLCIVMPAGLDEFFKEIGKPVKEGEFLPPPEMNETMIKKMETLAVKYGQKLFPPDYLSH